MAARQQIQSAELRADEPVENHNRREKAIIDCMIGRANRQRRKRPMNGTRNRSHAGAVVDWLPWIENWQKWRRCNRCRSIPQLFGARYHAANRTNTATPIQNNAGRKAIEPGTHIKTPAAA